MLVSDALPYLSSIPGGYWTLLTATVTALTIGHAWGRRTGWNEGWRSRGKMDHRQPGQEDDGPADMEVVK